MLSRNESAYDRSDDIETLTRENEDEAGADFDFLGIAQMAEDRDQVFKGAIQKAAWARAQLHLKNRHATDSKYTSTAFKNRSRIFRPKTISAVRKNMAACAAAMFSSEDVVTVKATNDTDPRKLASAAVLKELLNYRLDRTSANSGIPWFLVAMGANRDTQSHGVCYTKQFWEFEVVTERHDELVTEADHYADTGEPVYDDITGEPVVREYIEEVEKEFVTKDRPMSQLFAPENVILDPAAPWYDPCQTSMYLGLKHPMTLEDARTLLSNPGKGGEEWLDVPDELLLRSCEDYTSKGVRIARGDGVDRYDSSRGGERDKKSSIVWLHEWFIRKEGVDYHFWSVGTRAYASKVRTTRQAYPEQLGERPVTGGYGSIEPHEAFPTAAVTLWEQMQAELNDIVNLRLDIMKQALSPIAKVKQGRIFDWKQLQERGGPGTTIMVKNMEDLEFDRAPDVAGSAYEETNYLNADFDDLAGIFSGGSVQSNRQLNETVGGMRLLSGFANSVTEFDLRVFVETWAEKALRQIVRLEQRYETDERIFSIAGDRAKLMQRFGMDELTDDDLMHEVSVSVNVGIGAADPMQKLQKLTAALQLIQGAAPFFDKKVMVNAEEFIKEVMGPAGYNDGTRLFTITDFDEAAGSPEAEVAQLEAQMEEMRLQVEAELTAMQIEADRAMNTEDNQTKLTIANLQERMKLIQMVQKEAGEIKRAQGRMRFDAASSAMQLRNQRQMQLQDLRHRPPPGKKAA